MGRYIKKSAMIKIFSSKMAAVALIMFVTAWQYNQPFLEFIKLKNYPISWCIFPFFLASHQFMAIFYFCMIYLNTDVPFMQHSNMYQLIRTGRIKWGIGQIAGMILRYLFAIIMAAVIASLPFLGKMEWTNEWGKVVYTIATQNVSADFISSHDLAFTFYYEVLGKYSPIQLMLLTIGICILICAFLGLAMFLISLFLGRICAVSGAFILVIMIYFVQNATPGMKQTIAYFVPAYWAAVSLIATPSSGYYRLPSLAYMFTFLCIAIAAMGMLILFKIKHMEYNWENEDM